MPLSAPFAGRLADLVALDALKIAYAAAGDRQFLRLFEEQRNKVLASTMSSRKT
jgi:hypothetical protein